MLNSVFAAAAAGVLLTGGGAAELQDCEAGYQTFLGNLAKLVHTVQSDEAADVIRKSLAVYDSCKAGDSFNSASAWQAILNELTQRPSH